MKIILFILICLLGIFLFISGCSSRIQDSDRKFDILPNSTESIDKSICSDGICSISEDCNNCVKDCGCDNQETCSLKGSCEKEVCGNGKCSDDEEKLVSCCQDCGCNSEFICNILVQKCQNKIEITEEIINKTVNDYMIKNNILGVIIKIRDTYYKENSIKEVSIDCKINEAPYPCSITLFIDENGKIIDEMRTS